jgi:uncharacterized protein YcnI
MSVPAAMCVWSAMLAANSGTTKEVAMVMPTVPICEKPVSPAGWTSQFTQQSLAATFG